MAKSYWIGVACCTDSHRRAIRSWFSPMCDDMTPIEAKMLCDIETDREKKLRVVMRDADGRERVVIRSCNRGGYSITLKAPGASQ